MGAGDEWVTKTSRQSLKLLGTVGEPINPEAWEWYYDVVGERRCPVVDTWWQTETGAHMIDRKSTRLNSSHVAISYAVFCLKKKKPEQRVAATPTKHCPH